ncbi:uncharacterized protein EMH_0008710 [Eimeria mitis]|uniref:Uncharacterized protein n=1 Tax=Eimeria mitis TaxID=44415 RepID=U6K767_9EIME|nr:uncharacterized protein EMH_0008710 [Eimeria mitis]CDJ31318.1 hypothetical protein, conserved [Eimeria mitis]
MTAPLQFSLDLAELAPPWNPAAAPPSEGLPPFFVGPSASMIPEFGVYEDVARAPYTYFGHVPSAGAPRSRFFILAAIASISALAFLVLRCFALLSAESSLKVSGSPSRQLSDDDDVFSCPAGEDESSAAASGGEDYRSSGDPELSPLAQQAVMQQIQMLTLTRTDAQCLTQEEVREVAHAQASLRSLASRYVYISGRTTDLTRRVQDLRYQEERKGKEEDEGAEEEAQSSTLSRLMALQHELELEKQELGSIKEKLLKMMFSTDQDVLALFIRARFFSSGRSISAPASQALSAKDVVFGVNTSIPTQLTSDQVNRVGLLVTDLLLQSSSCRTELQRLVQQGVVPGQSRTTAQAITAPVVHRARGFLSDLTATAEQMRRAGMQARAKEVQHEAERMIRALETCGFGPGRVSPKTPKRLFGADATLTVEWKGPPMLWQPVPSPRLPWQRSPSADLFLSSEQSDDASTSSTLPDVLAHDLQTKTQIASSSRSVEETRRPRQSQPPSADPSSPWGSMAISGERKRLWRSFPEIFTDTVTIQSADTPSEEGAQAADGAQWRRRSASSRSMEDDSEASSDASSEHSEEVAWLTSMFPGEGAQQLLHHADAEQSQEAVENRARRGVKLMKTWTAKAEALLQAEVSSYAVYEQMKHKMIDGKRIISSWELVRTEAASPLLSTTLIQELRDQLFKCEQMLNQLQDRAVEWALSVLTASEASVKDSILSLREGVEKAKANDLNRIIFSNIMVGVANTILKAQKAHCSYAKLTTEVPEVSKELSATLLRLARKSLDAAVELENALTQVPPGGRGAARGESAARPQQPLAEGPVVYEAPPEEADEQQGAAAIAEPTTEPLPTLTETADPPPDGFEASGPLTFADPDDGGAALIDAAARKASSVLNKLKLR